MRRPLLLVSLVAISAGLAFGCDNGSDYTPGCPGCFADGGQDAGIDAGVDGGTDGGADSGTDGGVVGGPDGGMEQVSQLTVAEWNLEFFGKADAGPSDDALQAQNVATVMGQVGADVWALEEVCDEDRLQTVLNTLAAQGQPFEPVYPDQDLSSHGVSNPYGNYAGPWGQKTTFLFRTDRVRKLGAELVYNPADQVNGGSIDSNWGNTFASRDPLQVHLELSTSSGPWDLWFLVVHLKADSGATTSYPKRVTESADLKTYLDQYHPADRVMVVGDFNDDLDQSIDGTDPSPFQNFLDDSANWSFPSMAFTQAGLGTTTRYPNAIDHHLISNEVFGALVSDSPTVVHPSISNYSGTTSDHLPTVVRYQLP